MADGPFGETNNQATEGARESSLTDRAGAAHDRAGALNGGAEAGPAEGRGPESTHDKPDDGTHDSGSADGNQVDKHETRAPVSAREAFPDASPFGDLTEAQFKREFVDENGWPRYPDENDPGKPYAIPGTVRELTAEDIRLNLDGAILDRVGHPGGNWLAPDGTPYGERALPPTSLEKEYFRYRVHADNPLPPGWTIEESIVAPWFGQPGGGLQYKIVAPDGDEPSVKELIDINFLEPV